MADVRGRILFVSVHPPGHVPSQRFRYEQYVDYLAEEGLETTFAPILTEAEYSAMYRPGGEGRKALIAARGLVRRLVQTFTISSYDIVIVQREAIQLGTAAFEAAAGRSSAKFVFDFDDAIWLPDASPANKRFAWLKRPGKVSTIIFHADLVLAGNRYLADYACRFNQNVRVLPTTIDTAEYVPPAKDAHPTRVCIGWSGSVTTVKHLELAIPVFKRIKQRFGDRVYFKVIGDPAYRNHELGIQGVRWRPDTEVADLSELDIGIMPLPDDAWSRGKCGLKGLQYMGIGLPTIMSPVGVNEDIIEDGVNGYLASGDDEWVEKLERLIESADLRERLGAAARLTVVNRYSVESQKPTYLSVLTEMLAA